MLNPLDNNATQEIQSTSPNPFKNLTEHYQEAVGAASEYPQNWVPN
jgi:hypothetical protein